MFDALSAAPRRDHSAPQPPMWASPFFAFAARLGTFLLASLLGAVWLFTLFVGVMDFSPSSSPGAGLLTAIGVALIVLLSGGVLLGAALGRTHVGLARSVGGLLVALVCGACILALTVPVGATSYGFLLISSWAGAVAIVVTYLVAGLRVAPSPYQRYANLGCGVASWFLVTALTLPVPDQAFTTITLTGLPFAALGGLAGGALHRAFLGSVPPSRASLAPQEQGESGAQDAQAHAAPEMTAHAYPRPAASHGLAWRLLVAGLLGICAVPFGPGEPETLWISLPVLGCFAGIGIALDLSLRGWRPGLLLLLGGAIAIVWGGGAAIIHATGPTLFLTPTGAVAQAPFVAYVGVCAVLCLFAVGGAHREERPGPAEQGMLVQLAWQVIFWLAAGLSYWLGVATILLWRGAPGMLLGSETPGQISFAAALPSVLLSLPVALLGALVGGASCWALTHGERLLRSAPVD